MKEKLSRRKQKLALAIQPVNSTRSKKFLFDGKNACFLRCKKRTSFPQYKKFPERLMSSASKISMKNILRFLICAGVSLMALPQSFGAAKPNILFILADDLGIHDVSCYGSEIQTPNIDSIARDGLKFNQFYDASPICTPSRFGFLTGQYPNRSHDKLLGALMFVQERDDHRGIRANETTIAEVLRENGYQTALIGKWHLGHGEPEFLPTKHGFDYAYGCQGGCVDYFTKKYGYKPDWARNGKQIEEEGYSTDLITDDAVRYLKKKNEKPFFLFLSYTAPHYGKGWDEKEKKLTNILQAKPDERARFAKIEDPRRREYAGMVGAMDDGIGRVLETLKQQNLEKNTLVIFASDNGADPKYGGNNEPFRGHKSELFEGGIRVPCLMRWPGKIKSGDTTSQPICGIDFFPTFCALAGITESHAVDGVDISPVIFENKTISRDLFWRLPKMNAFRRGPWKYVRTTDGDMLFNLENDPGESKNLAKEKPKLTTELKAACAKVIATFKN
jgi:arylsulfatase A-like enzyme